MSWVLAMWGGGSHLRCEDRSVGKQVKAPDLAPVSSPCLDG